MPSPSPDFPALTPAVTGPGTAVDDAALAAVMHRLGQRLSDEAHVAWLRCASQLPLPRSGAVSTSTKGQAPPKKSGSGR